MFQKEKIENIFINTDWINHAFVALTVIKTINMLVFQKMEDIDKLEFAFLNYKADFESHQLFWETEKCL